MKTIIAKNKYGTYCIPSVSRNRVSAKRITNGQVWEPETIDFIRKYCQHDLIHAGVYFGDMLPAFKMINKVWAFEPNGVNYQCALKTIELNNLTNVSLMNVALGEESKIVDLMVERDGKILGGGSKVIYRGPQSGTQELGRMGKKHKTVRVSMTTLDSIIPQNSQISIIHLDVELYELMVLKGAIDIIKRCSPFLILETHRLDQNQELQQFLADFDYKQYTKEKVHKENTIWRRK